MVRTQSCLDRSDGAQPGGEIRPDQSHQHSGWRRQHSHSSPSYHSIIQRSLHTRYNLTPWRHLGTLCCSLGLIVKDKVGHLLPTRIYTETLPYSSTSSNNNMFYNSRDHNSIHDLVPPHAINDNNNYESVVSSPSSFSSYPRHKRRLSAGSGFGSSVVSDMVAVAAGAEPFTIEKLASSKEDQPQTYQRLIKQFEMDQPREKAPTFWESFINIRRWKN